jgi:hypothetical protein
MFVSSQFEKPLFVRTPFMRQELIDLFFSYNVSQDRHTVEAVVPTFSLAYQEV